MREFSNAGFARLRSQYALAKRASLARTQRLLNNAAYSCVPHKRMWSWAADRRLIFMGRR